MKGTTHLLATDLDGTLVGDAEGLKGLLGYYARQDYEVKFVYVTGRHYRSALDLIEEERLPVPHVLVTDVGTEIRQGPDLKIDQDWQAKIGSDWMPERIDAIAAEIGGIEKQQLPVTNRCSFHVSGERQARLLEQRLTEQQIPHKFIFSGGRDVDILPAHSGKGQALAYLSEKYRLEEAKWLVAGDSGNDLDMLTLGFPSVIVGNAQPELRACPDSPMIFRASKHCAGGIHEAWRHFHSS